MAKKPKTASTRKPKALAALEPKVMVDEAPPVEEAPHGRPRRVIERRQHPGTPFLRERHRG